MRHSQVYGNQFLVHVILITRLAVVSPAAMGALAISIVNVVVIIKIYKIVIESNNELSAPLLSL